MRRMFSRRNPTFVLVYVGEYMRCHPQGVLDFNSLAEFPRAHRSVFLRFDSEPASIFICFHLK